MENGKAEAKTYTEKEVIGFTIGILEGISYPAFLMEMPIQQMIVIKQNIIDQIAAAKGNLRTLLAEMEKAEKAAAEKPGRDTGDSPSVPDGHGTEGQSPCPESSEEDPEDEEIIGAEQEGQAGSSTDADGERERSKFREVVREWH